MTTDADLNLIHVERWGSSGSRVLMVHGGVQGGPAGGALNFAQQKPLAEAGWQLVIPDRPGHGRSPTQGWPDDAELDGMWVAALLGDGAHLVGHSFGGAVALVAAARRPEAVKSLTLIEPAAHSLATDDPRVRRFVIGMVARILLSWSPVRRMERIQRHLGIPPVVTGPRDEQALARMGKAIRKLRVPKKAMLERALTKVQKAGIPLLVISGGWSDAFDVSSSRTAALGGGRHSVLKSPHHFPQIASGAFNDVLAEFMKSSEGIDRPTHIVSKPHSVSGTSL